MMRKYNMLLWEILQFLTPSMHANMAPLIYNKSYLMSVYYVFLVTYKTLMR